MLVNVKIDVSWWMGLSFKVADFIGLFNFEWHSKNKVGNIGILILWRNHEKLYSWQACRLEGIKLLVQNLKDLQIIFRTNLFNTAFEEHSPENYWFVGVYHFQWKN